MAAALRLLRRWASATLRTMSHRFYSVTLRALPFVLGSCAATAPTPTPTATAPAATASATPATAPPARVAEDEVIRLASDIWPPFTGENDEPRVAIELVTQALERAGIGAKVDMVKVGALTPALEQARYQGTAAIWKSPEREKYLRFSQPYLENRLVLVGRKGSDVSFTRLAQLQGKRVGIVKAFAYGEQLERAPDTTFVRGASDQTNLRELLAGQLDYILVDDLIAHHLVIDYKAQTKKLLAVGRNPLITRPLHFAVRRSLPKSKQIIERFNAEIHKMMADGSIHEILEVAWIRTDMDGDGRSELVLGGKKAGSKAPKLGYDWLTQKTPQPTDSIERRSRIWIEGITYENWDDVPPRYKVEPEPLAPQRKGGIRFRFDIGL